MQAIPSPEASMTNLPSLPPPQLSSIPSSNVPKPTNGSRSPLEQRHIDDQLNGDTIEPAPLRSSTSPTTNGYQAHRDLAQLLEKQSETLSEEPQEVSEPDVLKLYTIKDNRFSGMPKDSTYHHQLLTTFLALSKKRQQGKDQALISGFDLLLIPLVMPTHPSSSWTYGMNLFEKKMATPRQRSPMSQIHYERQVFQAVKSITTLCSCVIASSANCHASKRWQHERT